MLGIRSSCLTPRRCDSALIHSLGALQPTLHRLYDAVARDVEFVTDAIRSRIPSCKWQAKELEVYRRMAPYAAQKARLLLPNSIYLEVGPGRCLLTVGNVQAGEPYHVDVLHRRMLSEGARSIQPGPLGVHCAAIAAAAALVHPDEPCVAVLTKPTSGLARRTAEDVRGVGSMLQSEYGIRHVLYVSMNDLAEAVVDSATKDLRLGPHRISVLYSRYDFSHPFGVPIGDAHKAVEIGSSSSSSSSSSSEAQRVRELWAEWETICKIESSRAIISSDMGCRLAHRRAVAYALSRPGGVERFLPDPLEVAAVRSVLPEQWSLRPNDRESEEAAALVHADADGFIAKNVFRPRTGSGVLQDRHASGGMPTTTAEGVRGLLRDEVRREFHLLYRKLHPVTHDAVVQHTDGTVHRIHAAAISELAAYGAFLKVPDGELINTSAGIAARTRPADADACGSLPALGYGALSCVAEKTAQG